MDRGHQSKLSAGTIPGLDGLRAISILLVMLSHSGLQALVPGVFGVTVFFFISGFLITTLLLREQERHGRIALGQFYIRRLLRLYPPLIVFVAVSAIAWTLAGHSVDWRGVVAALAYLANYASIFAPETMAGLGGQLWSLAVEEHFYAFYPLLMIALFPRRLLVLPVLLSLCAVALGIRTYVALAYPDIATAYNGMATETRIDAILFGAATAILCNRKGEAFIERWSHPVWVGLGLAAIIVSLLIRDVFFRETLRYTVQEIALVPLVLGATVSSRYGFGQKILNSWPMVQTGKLSYSLYLWHLAGFALGEALIPGAGWSFVLAMLLGWAVTFLLAACSYRFVEMPFFAMRRHFGSNVRGEAPAIVTDGYSGPERRKTPRLSPAPVERAV